MQAEHLTRTPKGMGRKQADVPTPASRDHRFDAAIAATRERLNTLQWQAAEAPAGLKRMLSEAFEELHATLEELQVADEELRQMNEELAIARQTAEAERQRYQDLFDLAPDGYVVTDAAAVIQEANRAAMILLAAPQAKLSGRPMVLFVARGERRAFLTQLSQLAEREQLQDWEVCLHPRNRTPFYAALTVRTVRDRQGQVVALRWLIRDISKRKVAETRARHAEHALRDSREQLRALTTHLQERQEEERRRIAREIHDELGQALTVLKIDLAWLATRFGATEPLYQQRFRDMSGLVDTLVTAVRRISTALRPEILDDLGLTAAIEWQLQEVCQRTGLAYDLELPAEDLTVEPALATAMFRIFQEALTNILRHAAASKVTVQLTQQPEMLTLVIIDNGRGITPCQLADRASLGVLSMRERAHLWGGDIIIQGKPDLGTTVTLQMPHEARQAVGANT
jgi:PAS domain S-box-containing protein